MAVIRVRRRRWPGERPPAEHRRSSRGVGPPRGLRLPRGRRRVRGAPPGRERHATRHCPKRAPPRPRFARRIVGATTRTARPSTPGAGPPACRRRPRSAPRVTRTPPSVGTARHPAIRVTGWPATARASSACPMRVSHAAEPSPWGRARAGSSAGSTLSASWSSAAASTRRRSTATPRASIRAASQPATSATARACRTNQAGGSRESRREAASTRPGTVIASMVPDGRGASRIRRIPDRWQSRNGRCASYRLSLGDDRGDRDGTPENCSKRSAARSDRRQGGGRPSSLGSNRHPVLLETDDYRAVAVGPEHPRPGGGEPVQRGFRRMAVRVARPGRGQRPPAVVRRPRTAGSWPSCSRDGRP